MACIGVLCSPRRSRGRRSRAEHSRPRTQATVEIVDRSEGRVLPIYWHDGRRYVIGKPGNEYAIRVRNTGGGRVLAVMSVDGINIITGDTASPQQSGYVLAPYESADIGGWRKSMSRTAAFYFTALSDSYAARTGRPDNVGVIGVARISRARPGRSRTKRSGSRVPREPRARRLRRRLRLPHRTPRQTPWRRRRRSAWVQAMDAMSPPTPATRALNVRARAGRDDRDLLRFL